MYYKKQRMPEFSLAASSVDIVRSSYHRRNSKFPELKLNHLVSSIVILILLKNKSTMFTSNYLKVIVLSHYSRPKFHNNDFLSGCF